MRVAVGDNGCTAAKLEALVLLGPLEVPRTLLPREDGTAEGAGFNARSVWEGTPCVSTG